MAQAGILFSPVNGGIFDISFNNITSTLYLPVVDLDVNTEVYLRNLVAYEACIAAGPLVDARYTELVNGIIDTEEDAKFLREKGIVLNHLKSDKEVADLWTLKKGGFYDELFWNGDDVYPIFLYDDDQGGAPNPSKVKTGTCPRAAHEVPLLTATANRVITMEDITVASGSSGTPSTVESPLRAKSAAKGGNDGADANAPPKVLRKDHVTLRPTQSTVGGKSLALMGLEAGSTLPIPTPQETPADISDLDPLSYAKPQSIPERDIAQSGRAVYISQDGVLPTAEKSTSSTSLAGSSGGIYQPGWGVTNSCRLDTPDVCQEVVDHIVPPGYFSELCHMPNDAFLNQHNINLARQVAMGSQLRLRFEQEVRLLKKARAQVARRDEKIQAREEEIKRLDKEVDALKAVEMEVRGLRNQTKNLETLLEAEVDMKKATEAKNVELAKELESLREEKIKAAFEEFKRYEDDKVEQRCAEIDARLDKLSIDFNEELYPHMLTAIAGRRWVIGYGLRLTVMKCAESLEIRQPFADVVSAGIAKGISEGLQYGIEHGKAGRDLGDVEAYDPEANNKLVKALQDLKDLKYPIWIRDLRPSSSQLKIPIYPEVRDPRDHWVVKEEVALEDAITANISRAEKKKKCRVVCRTHGIGSAHHARSDGVAVSVPTVAPQGLALFLMDAATRTEASEDKVSPRLIRSKSLPSMYDLDWP
ncbi:gypsy type transposase [Tanacetum coccineum]